MADDIDRAQDQAQMILDFELQRRKPVTLKPCGACHYCSSQVPATHLYCDADCRDDHEKELRMRRQNGVHA